MIYDLPFTVQIHKKTCWHPECGLHHETTSYDRVRIVDPGYPYFIEAETDEEVSPDAIDWFDLDRWDPSSSACNPFWYTNQSNVARVVRFLLDWGYPYADAVMAIEKPGKFKRYFIAGLVEDAIVDEVIGRSMDIRLEPVEEVSAR